MAEELSTRSGRVWRIGDVIADLYEVRWRTQGGMGVVYRVHHREWNMDLAVKTPRPEYAADLTAMRNFETEAETWVGLGLHPNVVACVYVRRLDGLPRVFAEWVDGGSLADAISSGRLYEGTSEEVLARILDVAIQFAWGLDYAHTQGLIHQDVKPANVMLAEDGSVKVTDFGLAKARAAAAGAVGGAPGASVVAGYSGMTPAYCSPEQAQAAEDSRVGIESEPLTRATDVWSWAISVWGMFTGERPVRVGQAAAEAFAAYRGEPIINGLKIPPMPEQSADLLARCLNPDPATRPRRMGELADELIGLYVALTREPYPRQKPEAAQLLADELNNNALSMLDLDRSDAAEQAWQAALDTDGQHVPSIFNRNLHRWRHGRLTETELIRNLQAMRPGTASTAYLLALVHIERRDTETAMQMLRQAHAQGLNDFEFDSARAALARAPVPAARPLTGHTATITTLALSADGRIAITGDSDGTGRVWDVATGRCHHVLSGYRPTHASRAYSARMRRNMLVAVDTHGKIALTGAAGSPDVQVWALTTGTNVRTLSGDTAVDFVALANASHTAVICGDRFMSVWDIASGQCTHSMRADDVPLDAVAVAPSGNVAITWGLGGTQGTLAETVRVWDLRSGVCIHTLESGAPLLRISDDGRIALIGNFELRDGPYASSGACQILWDLHYGQHLHTRRVGDALHIDKLSWPELLEVAQDFQTNTGISVYRLFGMAADGITAVTGGPRELRVWEVCSGRPLHEVAGDFQLWAVDANARTALTATGNSAHLWDLPKTTGPPAPWSYLRPQTAQQLTHDETAIRTTISTADELAQAGDWAESARVIKDARAIPGHRRDRELVTRWQRAAARAGERTALHEAWLYTSIGSELAHFQSAAISGDGRIALSALSQGDVLLSDVATGATLKTLRDPQREHREEPRRGHREGDITTFTGFDANTRLAIVAQHAAVLVWDVASGELLHRLDLLDTLKSTKPRIVVSPDCLRAVSVVTHHYAQQMHAWDLATGRCLMEFNRDHIVFVSSVALTADGAFAASVGADAAIRLWDVATGECVRAIEGQSHLRRVMLSPDGKRVITCRDDHEGTVEIWDLSTDERVVLRGHPEIVHSVAISPASRMALTDHPHETRLWDTETGTCLGALDNPGKDIQSTIDAEECLVLSRGEQELRISWLDWDFQLPMQAAAP